MPYFAVIADGRTFDQLCKEFHTGNLYIMLVGEFCVSFMFYRKSNTTFLRS